MCDQEILEVPIWTPYFPGISLRTLRGAMIQVVKTCPKQIVTAEYVSAKSRTASLTVAPIYIFTRRIFFFWELCYPWKTTCDSLPGIPQSMTVHWFARVCKPRPFATYYKGERAQSGRLDMEHTIPKQQNIVYVYRLKLPLDGNPVPSRPKSC